MADKTKKEKDEMLLTSFVIRSRASSSALVLPVVVSDDRPVTLPLSRALRGELDNACPFPLLLIVVVTNVDDVVLVPTIESTIASTILQLQFVVIDFVDVDVAGGHKQ